MWIPEKIGAVGLEEMARCTVWIALLRLVVEQVNFMLCRPPLFYNNYIDLK